jgi:hypothetical protein
VGDVTKDWTIFIAPGAPGCEEPYKLAQELATILGWPSIDADHVKPDEVAQLLGRTGLVVFTAYPPACQNPARILVLWLARNPTRAEAIYNFRGKPEAASSNLGTASGPGASLLQLAQILVTQWPAPDAS